MNSDDLMRLGPAAQKQVMEKMRKPGKYKAQKTRRGVWRLGGDAP